MIANPYKGTGVALITPFKHDKSVDFNALKKFSLNYVIDRGVNYLVALGTTAETPTLSAAEKQDVLINIIKKITVAYLLSMRNRRKSYC